MKEEKKEKAITGFTFWKSYGSWTDFVELGLKHMAACHILVESQLRSPDNTTEASLAYLANVIKAGPPPPFEAILVIFGSRALIFFLFESSWKKMKNDATFVRMRSGHHLGDAKCRKRAPRSVEFNFFNNCDRQKRFSQNERRRADLQKMASDFLIFAWGLSYDLSKFSDALPRFFDFERP